MPESIKFKIMAIICTLSLGLSIAHLSFIDTIIFEEFDWSFSFDESICEISIVKIGSRVIHHSFPLRLSVDPFSKKIFI